MSFSFSNAAEAEDGKCINFIKNFWDSISDFSDVLESFIIDDVIAIRYIILT